MLKPIYLLAGLAALGLGAVAHADTVTTYTLSNATFNCKDCGPYGTVVVDEAANQTSATVTVSLSDPGREIFFEDGKDTGDGDALEFNLPSGIAISDLTSGFEIDPNTPPDSTDYGVFTDGIICSYNNSGDKGACQNNNDMATTLSFTLTSDDGSQILFTPTDGIDFSASVQDKQVQSTDPAGDVGALAATPEPSSLALLGTGVLGFAGALRRRWKA